MNVRPEYYPPKWHKKEPDPNSQSRKRLRIGDRDGWICQLCKRPIEYRYEATLDHIIPLSLGGGNSYKNLQIAHNRCNSIKGSSTENLEPEHFLNYVSNKKNIRVKKKKTTFQLRSLGIVKLTPDDFHTNPVAELWNEIVNNKFQNLSFDKFQLYFEKYSAIKIQLLNLKPND